MIMSSTVNIAKVTVSYNIESFSILTVFYYVAKQFFVRNL